MKNYRLFTLKKIAFSIFLLRILVGCTLTNMTLKDKIYHQQIDSGKVIKVIRGGGGEFDIVYKDKGAFVDTIYVDGYSPMANEIDTATVLYKDSLNNYLRLDGLKGANLKRYSRTIDLMILFKD